MLRDVLRFGARQTHGGRSGSFAAYEDGFTLLELTRKHYREAGLDVGKLDLRLRWLAVKF